MKVSRRQFGLGLGATLLASKILGPFARRPAEAGTPNVAKRLIIFFSPNGTIPQFWHPSGTGTDFTFPAGSILEPLAPIQSDVIVCSNVDFIGFQNHAPGMTGMLTANGTAAMPTGGKSVDQYIAAQLGVTPLQFGVETGAWGATNQTRMCYSAPGTFVDPEDDPSQAFQSMFATAALPAGQIAELTKRRQSILDAITGDISDLRTQVGATERAKLDAHLESLRTTERGLATTTGGCAAPKAPPTLGVYVNDNFPAIGKTQMDLLVAALACGLTTVASIQWAHTVSPHVFTWLNPPLTQGHHDLSHSDDTNTAGVQSFVQAERWYATQFVYLVQQLAATAEPGGSGTMLDNTLLVWTKELGDSRLHDGVSVPFVFAGRAGGFLTPGRHIDFKGASHQALLVSLCQGMGLNTGTFGDPSISTGPLPGLT